MPLDFDKGRKVIETRVKSALTAVRRMLLRSRPVPTGAADRTRSTEPSAA